VSSYSVRTQKLVRKILACGMKLVVFIKMRSSFRISLIIGMGTDSTYATYVISVN
jgi:hypothetical protein